MEPLHARARLVDAAAFAAIKHVKQVRRYSGEPYVAHCVRVAAKLESLQKNFPVTDDMLIAALLHDTVEDTDCTLDELRARYGETVAQYVAALSLEDTGSRAQRYARYAQQLKEAPVEVQRIKMCDIWDNIGDIREQDPGFYPVYRRECLLIADHLDKLGADMQARLKRLINGDIAGL